MAKKKAQDNDDDGLLTPFSKKWEKKLPENFKERAEAYDNDELKKKIVEWEQAISITEKDMDKDVKLNAMKEEASSLKDRIKEDSKVYIETIDASYAQIKYSIYLLESRGVTLG